MCSLPSCEFEMKRASGFSLIELMIAMLIGLIILNGVVTLVINSKRSHLDNQAVSQIQENARFALDTLSRELRIAGYVGCMPFFNGEVDASSLPNGIPSFFLEDREFNSLQIFKNANEANTNVPAEIAGDVLPGTDVLVVRHTDTDNEWLLESDLASLGGQLQVTASKEMSVGAPIALVSQDCASASLLAIGAVADSGGTYSITADKANGSFNLASFKKGSRVSPLAVFVYYIGESSVLEDVPALKRERLVVNGANITSRSEELAIGVSGMTLHVGNLSNNAVVFDEGDDPNISVDTVAVRVELELRSHNRVEPPKTDGNGDSTNNDGFIVQAAGATVRIRNRG